MVRTEFGQGERKTVWASAAGSLKRFCRGEEPNLCVDASNALRSSVEL